MTDPLSDIHHYSPTFTIAQVIKFCEKKHMPLSRPMIQNYIRDGLLPPPAGRLYTQKHLAALALICKLKTVYDIPTIKEALTPHIDEEGLPLETYKWLTEKLQANLEIWLNNVAQSIAKEPEDKQSLLLMTHTTDIKDIHTQV